MAQPNFLLSDGYIRATQLSALNDPFEASYCKESLDKLSSHFQCSETGEELHSYVEKNKYNIGIICLTEAKDNLLMWSHYANEHKGAIVGIFSDLGSNISIFSNLFDLKCKSTVSFNGSHMFTGECVPVIYRKQPRYRVDMFDFDYSHISVEGADRILFEIFQQKSDEWIYEKEHRITLRLEQADKVQISDIENIKNKHILKKIKSLGCYSKDVVYGKDVHTIYLNKVADPIERECYADALVTLATNPANLYLFKLDSSAICSIFLGQRVNIKEVNLNLTYPKATGYFDVWKTTVNESFYNLQFEEIFL